jgi:hypothetical protein
MIEDPSLKNAVATVISMGETALVFDPPPPAGLVIGMGIGILGSFFGSAEEEEPSIADMFATIEHNLKGINQKLDSMKTAIGDLAVSLHTVTMMTQYNIGVVEEVGLPSKNIYDTNYSSIF